MHTLRELVKNPIVTFVHKQYPGKDLGTITLAEQQLHGTSSEMATVEIPFKSIVSFRDPAYDTRLTCFNTKSKEWVVFYFNLDKPAKIVRAMVIITDRLIDDVESLFVLDERIMRTQIASGAHPFPIYNAWVNYD